MAEKYEKKEFRLFEPDGKTEVKNHEGEESFLVLSGNEQPTAILEEKELIEGLEKTVREVIGLAMGAPLPFEISKETAKEALEKGEAEIRDADGKVIYIVKRTRKATAAAVA